MTPASTRTARCVLAALILLTTLLGGGVASAEEPFRVPEQVTDLAGVLDDGDRAEVEAAVDRLYTDQGLRLWVVLVDDFSGVPYAQWGERTAVASDFGDRDILLAVATVARSYTLNVPQAQTAISNSEISDLEQSSIEPALREEQWAGAATAAATGLAKAVSTTGSGSAGLWVALAVLVLVVVGALAFGRIRTARRRHAAAEAARTVDGSDPAAASRSAGPRSRPWCFWRRTRQAGSTSPCCPPRPISSRQTTMSRRWTGPWSPLMPRA